MHQARYNPPPLPGAVTLSEKTMENIRRPVDDPHPSTDDDLASLSTILGREPLNVAPQFPGRGWAIFSGFISIIANIAGLHTRSIRSRRWPGGRAWLVILGAMVEKVTGTVAAGTP
jgi:hypothetical protein